MPHVELPQAEFKVVLLGDSNSGKTSLVLRFVEGSYRSNRAATVGAFFLTKRLTLDHHHPNNNNNLIFTCKLLIWDTAGQPQFQRLAQTYYQQAAAAIVCVDLSSPDVAEQSRRLEAWLEQVIHNVGPSHRIVLIVAGCKCDLLLQQNHQQQQHVDMEEQVQAIAEKYQAIYVPTSAKDNINVTHVFKQAATAVLHCHQEAAMGKGRPIPITLGGGVGSSAAVAAAAAAIPMLPAITRTPVAAKKSTNNNTKSNTKNHTKNRHTLLRSSSSPSPFQTTSTSVLAGRAAGNGKSAEELSVRQQQQQYSKRNKHKKKHQQQQPTSSSCSSTTTSSSSSSSSSSNFSKKNNNKHNSTNTRMSPDALTVVAVAQEGNPQASPTADKHEDSITRVGGGGGGEERGTKPANISSNNDDDDDMFHYQDYVLNQRSFDPYNTTTVGVSAHHSPSHPHHYHHGHHASGGTSLNPAAASSSSSLPPPTSSSSFFVLPKCFACENGNMLLCAAASSSYSSAFNNNPASNEEPTPLMTAPDCCIL